MKGARTMSFYPDAEEVKRLSDEVEQCVRCFEEHKGDPEIRYLGDVQRLALKPGDTLVLSIDQHLSDEIANRLSKELRQRLHGDFPVIVLSAGMKLGVIGIDLANGPDMVAITKLTDPL